MVDGDGVCLDAQGGRTTSRGYGSVVRKFLAGRPDILMWERQHEYKPAATAGLTFYSYRSFVQLKELFGDR